LVALCLATSAVSGLQIGVLVFARNPLGWNSELDESLWVTLSLGVAGAWFLALLVAWIIDRQVVKPVRSITSIGEQLAAGHRNDTAAAQREISAGRSPRSFAMPASGPSRRKPRSTMRRPSPL
jgi:hypothetical protein